LTSAAFFSTTQATPTTTVCFIS